MKTIALKVWMSSQWWKNGNSNENMRNEALPNIRNKMFEFSPNKKIQELTFKSW